MEKIIIGLAVLTSIIVTPTPSIISPTANEEIIAPKVLAEHTMDLRDREINPYANEVFSDNILLALHYFKGDTNTYKYDANKQGPDNIDWEKIRQPFEFSIDLKPGQIFAFHDNISSEYSNSQVLAEKTKFNYEDGYKAVAGLSGNGVCHLATLMNWVAKDASFYSNNKIEVTAKVNHDFAPVPDIPREYGTSIYYSPDGGNSQNQNLYIKNNSQQEVIFNFSIKDNKVDLKISSY